MRCRNSSTWETTPTTRPPAPGPQLVEAAHHEVNRESLVAERTRAICRLRWHLHELDPSWEPKARSLDAQRTLDEVLRRLDEQPGLVARLARELTNRCAELTLRSKSWRSRSRP